MEDIPALFSIDYQNISVIAKYLSGFVKTSILVYPLNSDVISEEDLISGRGPNAVAATGEVDGSSPSRGGTDPSHEKNSTGAY
jgi:hypothetical protein